MKDLEFHIDAASRVNGGWVLRIFATYSSGPYSLGFMQVRVDDDFNMVSYLPQDIEADVQTFLKLMRLPVILGLFQELE